MDNDLTSPNCPVSQPRRPKQSTIYSAPTSSEAIHCLTTSKAPRLRRQRVNRIIWSNLRLMGAGSSGEGQLGPHPFFSGEGGAAEGRAPGCWCGLLSEVTGGDMHGRRGQGSGRPLTAHTEGGPASTSASSPPCDLGHSALVFPRDGSRVESRGDISASFPTGPMGDHQTAPGPSRVCFGHPFGELWEALEGSTWAAPVSPGTWALPHQRNQLRPRPGSSAAQPLRCLLASGGVGSHGQASERPTLALPPMVWKREAVLPRGSRWDDGLLLPALQRQPHCSGREDRARKTHGDDRWGCRVRRDALAQRRRLSLEFSELPPDPQSGTSREGRSRKSPRAFASHVRPPASYSSRILWGAQQNNCGSVTRCRPHGGPGHPLSSAWRVQKGKLGRG